MNRDLSNIRFVQIREALLVPRVLLEQAKGTPFTPEDFYQNFAFYAESPFTFLYSIVDKSDMENPQKGVLWASVDPISRSLVVNFVSLETDYQGTGLFRNIIIPRLIEMREQLGLRRIYWSTTRPRAFQRLSDKYRPAKLVLMELEAENG